MRFLGLSPLAFVLGLAGLLTLLGILHLLRIRLRRVEVETLLFYRQAGQLTKPRSLFGRPARLWAFLLALLLISCLWLAFAQPLWPRQGASRVILLDQSSSARRNTEDGDTVWEQTLAWALDLASELGPRGAVLAYGSGVQPLLDTLEPTALLRHRCAKLEPSGPGSALEEALRQARHRLQPGDQIILLGGPPGLPSELEGVQLHRLAPEAISAGPRILDLQLQDWPERRLRVKVTGVGLRLQLLLSKAKPGLAVNCDSQGLAWLQPLPEAETQGRLQLFSGDELVDEVPLTLPRRRPIDYLRQAGLPLAVRLALAADPALHEAATGEARVQIAMEQAISPALPALLLQQGQGAAPRRPIMTEFCPLELSLQDWEREAAPSLLPVPGETIWVEDSLTGAPLVAAHREEHAGKSVLRLRMVAWLLEEPAHRDLPRLLFSGMRILAGSTAVELQVAGRPFSLPAALDQALNLGGKDYLPSRGRFRACLGSSSPPFQVVQLSGPPLPGQQEAPPELDLGSPGQLLLPLGLLALLLLLLDLFLYHRRRLP